MKKENARELAEHWNRITDTMQPVVVPDGYKAEYLYEQSLLHKGTEPMPLPQNVLYQPSHGWGIISVISEHELDMDETDRYMDMFRQAGAVCIGRLRLTKQTMRLDTGENDEWQE